MWKVSFREFDFRVAIKCIERYFLGLVHSNGSKQCRAIVLNRFGLALIGRIAPDRSDADYVRRTRSTKRLARNPWLIPIAECIPARNPQGPRCGDSHHQKLPNQLVNRLSLI